MEKGREMENKIKLSVLICSTHTRRNTFLPVMLDRVYSMYEMLRISDQEHIEILVLVDNKKMMLGEKRNAMIDIAQGEYIVFIDDDDRIEDSYLSDLLTAIDSGADVITFQVSVSLNGNSPKLCYYSKDYLSDCNTDTCYLRIPNHICCVKRDLSMRVSFPNIKYGEDAAYAKLLLPHLQSQHQIDKVLYHYDFNANSTETQEHLSFRRSKERKSDPLVDVIVLSNAKNEELKALTNQTIETCIVGANGLSINIIVVESQPDTRYDNAHTIYHSAEFNYNGFANLGIRHGQAKWVMVANNDLIFKHGWLHELIAANHPLVSPKCPVDSRQYHINRNESGLINGVHFSGWCFMMTRELWNEIDGLDTDFEFWCSDDATIEQANAVGITPMIVPKSHVEHLQSSTFNQLPRQKWDDYTWKQVEIFNRKYNQNKFVDNPNFQAWKQKKHSIGIGITTRNRRGIFDETYRNICKYAPSGSKIVVIDDASDIPLSGATERFEYNIGIAAAKNACLRHLEDCEHIFLFDDDCYPKQYGWELPYINSGYAHLCLSFEHNSIGQRLSHSVYVKEKRDDIWIYNAPNGCMVYLRKCVLEEVGGLDEGFGIWGHEHPSWSWRIHNAGLTPHPFMDIPNSLDLFHVCDYYGSVESSVPDHIRIDHIEKNAARFEESQQSKEFIDYK